MDATTTLAITLGSLAPSHGDWAPESEVSDYVPDAVPRPSWQRATNEINRIAKRWHQQPMRNRLWRQWAAQNPPLAGIDHSARWQVSTDGAAIKALATIARTDGDAFDCFVAKSVALLWKRGTLDHGYDAGALFIALHDVDLARTDDHYVMLTIARRARRVFYRRRQGRQGPPVRLVNDTAPDWSAELAPIMAIDAAARDLDQQRWTQVVGFYCNHIPKGLTKDRRRARDQRARFHTVRPEGHALSA